MNGAKNPVYPLEASPEALHDACVVWERERGDSLPHRQKKRIAHRVSVDQPSLCAVVQSAAAGWRKKIGGGGSFLCAVLRGNFLADGGHFRCD